MEGLVNDYYRTKIDGNHGTYITSRQLYKTVVKTSDYWLKATAVMSTVLGVKHHSFIDRGSNYLGYSRVNNARFGSIEEVLTALGHIYSTSSDLRH